MKVPIEWSDFLQKDPEQGLSCWLLSIVNIHDNPKTDDQLIKSDTGTSYCCMEKLNIEVCWIKILTYGHRGTEVQRWEWNLIYRLAHCLQLLQFARHVCSSDGKKSPVLPKSKGEI